MGGKSSNWIDYVFKNKLLYRKYYLKKIANDDNFFNYCN